MDFIFGTLVNDELKLVHHRAKRSGLQHNHALQPHDPRPGESATLTVTVGAGLQVDYIACYFTLDGTIPVGSYGVATNGYVVRFACVETVWDTLIWGYTTRWQVTLPAQPEGVTVRYRIGAWAEGGIETFADWPEVKTTTEHAAMAYFRQESLPKDFLPDEPTKGHTFTYRVDTLCPPHWARETVIYQIFVDRFYPGNGRDWLQTRDLNGICGGTLNGVIDKLDYISDLGVNCLWLSPIFVSPSHHGYDATDYKHVEPRIGGDETLHKLVEVCHARGIRVLLDLACNHISNDHETFKDAVSSSTSPYRDWFTFDDSEIGYRTFFNVATMPELNLANPAARDWMVDIACFWLREFEVDGYRLDYANGPGPDFWPDFWAACKAEKPDAFCFGEVIDAPDAIMTYSGRLDGCLDFHTGEAIRKTFAWGKMTKTELNRFLERHYRYFPDTFLLPTFIDNHDMDRFLFIAGGDKAALKRAATIQMCLPGPPIIFYGTEVGLSQEKSTRDGGLHYCRTPMVWGDKQDKDLLNFYKTLIRQKRSRQ